MYDTMSLVMITYFIVKHFVCDFPISIQTPWMFLNKGTYGHPGGIVHASIHAAVSFPVFIWAWSQVQWWPQDKWHGMTPLALAGSLVLFEFLVHYHMDWFKMWWCRKKQYRADTHPQFWVWLGIDQMVHYLTYVVMVGVWVI